MTFRFTKKIFNNFSNSFTKNVDKCFIDFVSSDISHCFLHLTHPNKYIMEMNLKTKEDIYITMSINYSLTPKKQTDKIHILGGIKLLIENSFKVKTLETFACDLFRARHDYIKNVKSVADNNLDKYDLQFQDLKIIDVKYTKN